MSLATRQIGDMLRTLQGPPAEVSDVRVDFGFGRPVKGLHVRTPTGYSVEWGVANRYWVTKPGEGSRLWFEEEAVGGTAVRASASHQALAVAIVGDILRAHERQAAMDLYLDDAAEAQRQLVTSACMQWFQRVGDNVRGAAKREVTAQLLDELNRAEVGYRTDRWW